MHEPAEKPTECLQAVRRSQEIRFSKIKIAVMILGLCHKLHTAMISTSISNSMVLSAINQNENLLFHNFAYGISM